MSTDTRKPPGADQSGGGRMKPARQLMGEPDAPAIGDWLRFESDGSITVFSGKAEVGQGIRTSLAQAVAEELRVPADQVSVVLGDTARTPFDMGTFGSRTTPVMADRLHKVAASARELLIERAAERLGIDRSELKAADGKVTQTTTGLSFSYAELAADGFLDEPWTEDAAVTPAEGWAVAGNSAPRVDSRDFVTGRHRYASDLKLPDMQVGAVLRPPAFNSSLASLDSAAAEAMPGVTVVHEGDFVGVAAPTRRAARAALVSIKAEWRTPDPSEQPTNETIYDFLKDHPTEDQGYHRWGGPTVFETGSLQAGMSAGRALRASYTVPYIAHAPLEPRVALAAWDLSETGEECLSVWTGSQRPFGVRNELAAAFGIPEERVRVVVPDTGAAYGGKHTGEVAVEAARLARAARRPVRVMWSREEEFTWAYFRPAGLIEVASAASPDGEITAWEYTNYNSGAEAMRPPYAIENQRVAFQTTASPLRQGSYRALAATANHFARESHIDELAHLVGMDALAFRLRNLPAGDENRDRVRAVLQAAAERFGWGSRHSNRQPGRGFGMACGTEKGSYVATCAEVEVDRVSGQVHVVQVVEAFECGAIVNPDGLANQIEGAIMQALGGALFEQIEFAGGKILNGRFSNYRVPRFRDLPRIEAVLLDRKDLRSAGAGETPIVGLAPALANAIFDATGIRVRDLPLTGANLSAAQALG